LKLFLDTASLFEIRQALEWNLLDSVTTNPTLLAAKAGLSFVSPFVGRLDDIGHEGMETVRQILEILRQHSYPTQVIVASVRHPLHVIDAARMGAPIVTVPFGVLQQMFTHPLTDLGLRRFLEDWQSVPRRTSPVDAQKLSGSSHET